MPVRLSGVLLSLLGRRPLDFAGHRDTAKDGTTTHMIYEASTRTLLDTAFPALLQGLVESLLPARFLVLHVAILLLEATILPFVREHLLDKRALSLLVLETAGEELGGTLNDGADLAVLGRLHFPAILLVMAMRVKYTTHLNELQVALQLWRQVGLGQVEPFVARSGFLLLYACQPSSNKTSQ
jgi:hypothetical protein